MRELISRKVGKGGAEIIFFNKCGDGGGGFEWVEENLWWVGGGGLTPWKKPCPS